METLKRKVNLEVKGSIELSDGTKIELVPITVKEGTKIANDKKLSDFDRGVHMIAAQIRVDGQPIVYDDLLNSFTMDEFEQIANFVNKKGDEAKND